MDPNLVALWSSPLSKDSLQDMAIQHAPLDQFVLPQGEHQLAPSSASSAPHLPMLLGTCNFERWQTAWERLVRRHLRIAETFTRSPSIRLLCQQVVALSQLWRRLESWRERSRLRADLGPRLYQHACSPHHAYAQVSLAPHLATT